MRRSGIGKDFGCGAAFDNRDCGRSIAAFRPGRGEHRSAGPVRIQRPDIIPPHYQPLARDPFGPFSRYVLVRDLQIRHHANDLAALPSLKDLLAHRTDRSHAIRAHKPSRRLSDLHDLFLSFERRQPRRDAGEIHAPFRSDNDQLAVGSS